MIMDGRGGEESPMDVITKSAELIDIVKVESRKIVGTDSQKH